MAGRLQCQEVRQSLDLECLALEWHERTWVCRILIVNEGKVILVVVGIESFLCENSATASKSSIELQVEVVALVENRVFPEVGAKFHELQSVDLRSLDVWIHLLPLSTDEFSLPIIALG